MLRLPSPKSIDSVSSAHLRQSWNLSLQGPRQGVKTELEIKHNLTTDHANDQLNKSILWKEIVCFLIPVSKS